MDSNSNVTKVTFTKDSINFIENSNVLRMKMYFNSELDCLDFNYFHPDTGLSSLSTRIGNRLIIGDNQYSLPSTIGAPDQVLLVNHTNEVVWSTLTLSGEGGSQGPTGPSGLQGPIGPTGLQGPTGFIQTLTNGNGSIILTNNGNYYSNNLIEVTSNINIGESIIPSLNNSYDLGSSNNKWRNLYLSPGTIYFGQSGLINSDNNGNIFINNLLGVNTISSGSISADNLTGISISSILLSSEYITASSIIVYGNIGIGCNVPTVSLDVLGSGRFFSTSTTTPISLYTINNYIGQNLTGNDITMSQLFFGNKNFQNSIQTRISSTDYSDSIRLDFCTVSTFSLSSQQTRMSIMPFTGNVGIGNTNPTQKLVVNGHTQTSTLIASGVSTITISSANIFGSQVNVSSIFTTGNVGIGCNAPSTRLDVSGKLKVTYDGPANLVVTTTTGPPNPSEIYFSNGSLGAAVGMISTSRNFFIWQNSDRLNMDINGNFGINCNAPSTKLDVNGTGKFNDSLLVSGNATLPTHTGGIAYFTGGYVSPTAGRLVFGDGLGWYYRFSTRSSGTTTDLVSIRDNGYVGMGITTPICPLDVRGSVTYSVSTGYQMNVGGTAPYGGASESLTIHSAGVVWSENKFVASSDQRIKKDIVDIDDNEALYDLRLIEPKKYKYIDQISRGSNTYYGFIAQQISSVFNDAVQERTSFVPNYFNTVSTTVETIENSSYITSFEISNEFLSTINQQSTINVQFYDYQNKTINATVSTISSNTFTAITNTNDITMFSSTLLLYGSEVNDFLTLNKDYLFTLNFAATQQIDRIQQEHSSTIISMQSRLDEQQSTINYLLSRLS